ncbi:hypothetical protein [Streptomyces pinistramenti]|uniref:hypothetical protein n=1 Tax=Streptomyces pinistramenti TaxID=2884812 RepID=UPI00355743F9
MQPLHAQAMGVKPPMPVENRAADLARFGCPPAARTPSRPTPAPRACGHRWCRRRGCRGGPGMGWGRRRRRCRI